MYIVVNDVHLRMSDPDCMPQAYSLGHASLEYIFTVQLRRCEKLTTKLDGAWRSAAPHSLAN